MKVNLAGYLTTLAAFLGIDFIWLSFSSERLYRPILKDILVDGFRPAPAIVFYLLYAAGLVYFAVRPGLAANPGERRRSTAPSSAFSPMQPMT